MLPIIRSFQLDIGRAGSQYALYVRQGDSQVYGMRVTLVEHSMPIELTDDCVITLAGTKPDGEEVLYDGIVEDGRIKAYFGTQAFTAHGIMQCEFTVYDVNQNVLYSPRFDVNIEASISGGGAESSSEFTALETALATVTGYAETLAEAIEAASGMPEAISASEGSTSAANSAATSANVAAAAAISAAALAAPGSVIYSGSAITGTSTTPTVYATGLESVNDVDYYINNDSLSASYQNKYKCTLGGDAATALWAYDSNVRGAPGTGNLNTVNSKLPDVSGNVDLSASDVGAVEQFSTMPAAIIGLLGRITQFVGTTGGGYTNGYFYKCQSDGGAGYEWVALDTGAYASSGDMDEKTDLTVVGVAYSALSTYALGTFCTYNKLLYECTTAIESAEAWTIGHWTQRTIGYVLKALNDGKLAPIASPTNGNVVITNASGEPQDGAVALTSLQTKQTITVNANESPALGTLANNTEYRCTDVTITTAPTMTFASIASTAVEFACAVVYKASNATAPVVTNNSGYTLKYKGDGVASGTFTPVNGTAYRMSFLFDGIYLNCYIVGVA